MRITASAVAALGLASSSTVNAFAPIRPQGPQVLSTTARFVGLEPAHFQDLAQSHHVDSLLSFGSMLLSDVDMDAASAVVDAATDTAAVAATDAAASSGGGPMGIFAGPIEGLLEIIHSALVGVGVESNTWGLSILLMTATIKLLTFPLTKTQMESTNKMQAIQPQVKELQSKYQSNPEVMNQKIAEIYQANDVNPLAGCLPSVAQIPIFIGLYRAVLNLAKENKLDEPFLFLPNLEGPTYGADPGHANDWILKGWTDGAPSLGWSDTTSFLILPVVLVLSQFLSMQLMQPDSEEARAQQPAVLKFLPLLIGYFSLSVPAALTIYWFANNVITTASTLYVKSTVAPPDTAVNGATATMTPEVSAFQPPVREKPSGFAATSYSEGGVSPITAVDAEIVEDGTSEEETPVSSGEGIEAKKRGSKKKKKKRKN